MPVIILDPADHTMGTDRAGHTWQRKPLAAIIREIARDYRTQQDPDAPIPYLLFSCQHALGKHAWLMCDDRYRATICCDDCMRVVGDFAALWGEPVLKTPTSRCSRCRKLSPRMHTKASDGAEWWARRICHECWIGLVTEQTWPYAVRCMTGKWPDKNGNVGAHTHVWPDGV